MLTPEKVDVTGKSKPDKSGIKISIMIGKYKSRLIRTFIPLKLKPIRKLNKIPDSIPKYCKDNLMPSITLKLQSNPP